MKVEKIEAIPLDALMSFGMLVLSKRKRGKFADEVTSALHQIHCNKNEKFGDTISPDCDDWIDYYRPFAKAVMDKAEEMYKANALSEGIITAMLTNEDRDFSTTLEMTNKDQYIK